MGLKVNRQNDMDKLFDKFASLPDVDLGTDTIDSKKKAEEAARKRAYEQIDRKQSQKKGRQGLIQHIKKRGSRKCDYPFFLYT